MKKDELKSTLARAVKQSEYRPDIKWLAIFGSYVTGEAKETSDVDVLIDFTEDAHVGFFKYVRIRRSLSDVLGLQVDMVTPQALSKYIKQQVLEQAETVYER
jgi:predicted nucleotidyltransferase